MNKWRKHDVILAIIFVIVLLTPYLIVVISRYKSESRFNDSCSKWVELSRKDCKRISEEFKQ